MRAARFRTFSVDVHVLGPTVGSVDDWEQELKRRIRRTVNNQAMARRHGVQVRPPGSLIKHTYKDIEFSVFANAVPFSRRQP